MQGGWGAQHRSDMGNFPFQSVESGKLDRYWCWHPGGRFNAFLKMLTRRRPWRIFPRNSKRLDAEKMLISQPNGFKRDRCHPI